MQNNTATTLQIHTEMGVAGKVLHNTAAGIQTNNETKAAEEASLSPLISDVGGCELPVMASSLLFVLSKNI
jgi:hypothetical protein